MTRSFGKQSNYDLFNYRNVAKRSFDFNLLLGKFINVGIVEVSPWLRWLKEADEESDDEKENQAEPKEESKAELTEKIAQMEVTS